MNGWRDRLVIQTQSKSRGKKPTQRVRCRRVGKSGRRVGVGSILTAVLAWLL